MRSKGYSSRSLHLCVCLSATILALHATRWLMSDTNSFSATRSLLAARRAEGASNCVEWHLNLNGRDTSLIWTYSPMGWWIGVAVTSPTCRPARRSCRGFETRTHAGGLRWGEKSVCTACVWALVCTQL